jgi:hypothetical protein
MTLPLTGPTLVGYNNLPAIPPNEPLGDLLNSIVAGGIVGQVTSADRLLESGSVSFSVPMPQAGLYSVRLMLMLNLVGTGGTEGASVASIQSGGLVLSATNIGVMSSTGDRVVKGLPFTLGIDIPLAQETQSLTLIEALLTATTPGVLVFTVAVLGTPTSATLLKGSGFTSAKVSVTP